MLLLEGRTCFTRTRVWPDGTRHLPRYLQLDRDRPLASARGPHAAASETLQHPPAFRRETLLRWALDGRRTACAKRRAPAPRGADTERGRVNTQHVFRHWAALGRKQSKGKGRFYLAAQVFAVAYDYFKLICVKISLLKGCQKIT